MKRIIFFISFLALIFVGYLFAGQNNNSTPTNSVSETKIASSDQNSTDENVLNPVNIKIDKINVDADIEHVGLDSKNNMDVPKKAENTGWYRLGPKPGETGSAVIAGHLDGPDGSPAVFWNLSKLEKGDTINITDEEGNRYKFLVTEIKSYPFDEFPLQKVFADINGKKLNLITCEGTFDKGAKNYSHRTVVYAEM